MHTVDGRRTLQRLRVGRWPIKWSLLTPNAYVNASRGRDKRLSYNNTTVYYGIRERRECIPVDSGVTILIHDRRSCVDFTLEVEANVARCVHSSVNNSGLKRNSGL